MYKVALLVFKALHDRAPTYIRDLIQLHQPFSVRCSDDTTLLAVPSVSKQLKTGGERSFQSNAPRIWNDLPRDVRYMDSLDDFKKRLKTEYFKVAVSDYV